MRTCDIVAGMDIRWLTVFLDFPARKFAAGVAFWQAVTGYGRSAYRGADGEFATLLPPAGDAYLRVQRVRAGSGGCHLDLHLDPGSLDEAARHAARLGATVRHRDADGRLILIDSPGGFTFCLVEWDGELTVSRPLVTAGGASRVDTLCLDIPPEGFGQERDFWAALTGREARPIAVPGFAYLEPTAAAAGELPVRLLVQRLDAATGGTRAHVDVGCVDEQATARHVALGARVIAAHAHWTVLADPAGREYCLVSRPLFG
jgi:hypothetical protein